MVETISQVDYTNERGDITVRRIIVQNDDGHIITQDVLIVADNDSPDVLAIEETGHQITYLQCS